LKFRPLPLIFTSKNFTGKIIQVQNGITAKPMCRTLPGNPAAKALRRRVLPDCVVSNQWTDRLSAPIGTLAHGPQGPSEFEFLMLSDQFAPGLNWPDTIAEEFYEKLIYHGSLPRQSAIFIAVAVALAWC
jgi:hypothetical protein